MNIEYQIIKKNDNFCIDETKFMNLLGTNKNYIIDKDKNNTETDENILYYADFIQLKNFLFIRYPNKFIEQDKFIEKLKMDDYNKDTIIKDFEYKSNWDRYFESIIDKGELEENLGELYKYRNLVAHNRKIRLNESERTETLTNQVKKRLKSVWIKSMI